MREHKHNFLATDIPGVCLCKCGVERYYSRELQDYVMVEVSSLGGLLQTLEREEA